MKAVTEEKDATKAELEDTREDLDIAIKTVQQQALATDIWQRKFDELSVLVSGKRNSLRLLGSTILEMPICCSIT